MSLACLKNQGLAWHTAADVVVLPSALPSDFLENKIGRAVFGILLLKMVTIQRLDGLLIIFAEGMVTGHIAVGMFENTAGHHGIRVATDCLGDIAGAGCAGDAADVSIGKIEGVPQLMHDSINSVEEIRRDWSEL